MKLSPPANSLLTSTNDVSTEAEMPKYKCHKEVHALKIKSIVFPHNSGMELHFRDEGFAAITIKNPEGVRIKQAMRPYLEENDLGYLVIYEDGYRSWSPTKAFEDGYTRL